MTERKHLLISPSTGGDLFGPQVELDSLEKSKEYLSCSIEKPKSPHAGHTCAQAISKEQSVLNSFHGDNEEQGSSGQSQKDESMHNERRKSSIHSVPKLKNKLPLE